MKLKYPPGATPLNPDETAGLIPDYITTQGELNELEAKNIQEAIRWLQKKKPKDTLNVSFLMDLHKRMFKDVWKWAGAPRKSEKNIGVAPGQIMTKLGSLLKDVQFWIDNETYSIDEIAVRFHHRLVFIHVYPNGNGRHARLITDWFLTKNGHKSFSWGRKISSEPIEVEGKIRSEYISALRAADGGNIKPILKFVRE